MALFRKKPVLVEATQWFSHIDTPIPYVVALKENNGSPDCGYCGDCWIAHGWVSTLEGGHIVCPGDWVVTGIKGEHHPVKPDIFRLTYEPV